MIKKKQKCLSVETLQQIGDGELQSDVLRNIETHVTDCTDCRELFDTAHSDQQWRDEIQPILSRPTDTFDSSMLENENAIGNQDALQLLGPTDDPHMLGRIGTYEVVGVIGRGGMGVVFKAFDAALDRFVAIKMLAPHLAASAAARKRFSREGQAAAAVVDDNVLPIYGVDQWQGVPYLVMQYSRGISLQERIRQQGPLELKEILRIGLQMARGLAAAHDQGLVHRDVKPSNILLSATVERALLTDFGLARAVDDASMTRSGMIAGTPQYMSPEQVRAEVVDQRSDQFGLGAVLYAMCTAAPPFRADTSYGVMRMITDREPRPIQEKNSDIPIWLCTIVQRLMSKQPIERFDTTHDIADLLQQCLAHAQQPASVPLPAELSPQPKSRRWKRTSLLIGLSAICFTLFAIGIAQIVSEPGHQGDKNTQAESATAAQIPAADSAQVGSHEKPETTSVANTPGRSEAEKAIVPLVLVFHADKARRVLSGLLVRVEDETWAITTGPAAIVPDGVAPAIDRTFVERSDEPNAILEYSHSTSQLFAFRSTEPLTSFELTDVAEMRIGDQLSAMLTGAQLNVLQKTAKVWRLGVSAQLNLQNRKLHRRYKNLALVDVALPEGTPLFKNGKLAGMVLLGERFADDKNLSYVLPASEIKDFVAAKEVVTVQNVANRPAGNGAKDASDDGQRDVLQVATQFYAAMHQKRTADAAALMNGDKDRTKMLTQIAKLVSQVKPNAPRLSINRDSATAVFATIPLPKPHPDVGDKPRFVLQLEHVNSKWMVRDVDLFTEADAMGMLRGAPENQVVNVVQDAATATNNVALVMLMHPAELKKGNSVQKAAGSVAMGHLSSTDHCGILQYGVGGVKWLWGGDQGLVPIRDDRAEYMQALASSHPGDLPQFDRALKLSFDAFASVKDARKLMIILTDGDPTLTDKTWLKRFSAANIKISVVHLNVHDGEYVDAAKTLASTTGGRYYHVRTCTAAVVERIFRREVRSISAPQK